MESNHKINAVPIQWSNDSNIRIVHILISTPLPAVLFAIFLFYSWHEARPQMLRNLYLQGHINFSTV